VLKEAVRAGAEGLRTPFCKLHRYRSAQDDLLREAGFGWHSDVTGQVVLPADARSPEGRAFVNRQPVLCNELRDAIDKHAGRCTVSTVDVIIRGGDAQPYGVLGASNNAQQAYDQNDVNFLSGIADILAESIASFARVEMLKSTIERLQSEVEERNQGPVRAKMSGVEPQPKISKGWQRANWPPGEPREAVAPRAEGSDGRATAYPVSPAIGIADGPLFRAPAAAVTRAVLIVEDDVVLQEILTEHFAAEGGFTVCTAATLAEADAAILDQDRHFDAIVLDVGLPDGNGCEYCARLRRDGHEMPIIMLTGCNDEIDVVRGLDSGANDYVSKPCSWSELFARLRVQLRLFEESEAAVFTIGPYLFRPGKKLLEDKARRRRILLTNMEAAVLKFLYRWGPGVVERHVLAKEVWGYNSRVTTHTLETHMYRLRQKMEANPHTPALLITDKGGYRLNSAMAVS
jgi:DNA-binding response OmpR family regulator